MNNNIYFSIAIVGLIISILEYFVADNRPMAYSFILLTLTVILGIYLISEWRYYRSHNAVLASSQFLLIPAGMIITGNILAPKAVDGPILNFNFTFLDVHINSVSTITSIFIIFPAIVFGKLIVKYYKKEYSGFVIQHQIYSPIKIPLLIHSLLLLSIIYSRTLIHIIDFIAMVFLVWSILAVIFRLVVPSWQNRRREFTPQERRRFVNAITAIPPQITRRGLENRPRSDDIPSRPRSGMRTVGVRPSSGYREIVTRSSRDQNLGSGGQPRAETMRIDDGITIHSHRKPVKKIPPNKINKYLPNGHFRKDDLRCMVCYQEFSGTPNYNVSICSYCKFPAHEVEFSKWLASSDRCPRCNKMIGNSILHISEKQYVRLISKL